MLFYYMNYKPKLLPSCQHFQMGPYLFRGKATQTPYWKSPGLLYGAGGGGGKISEPPINGLVFK